MRIFPFVDFVVLIIHGANVRGICIIADWIQLKEVHEGSSKSNELNLI
jgi:hypothetical protein